MFFSGNQLISLPNIAALLTEKQPGWQVWDTGLTTLTLSKDALHLDMATSFHAEETVVTLTMLAQEDDTDLQTALAPVLYHLARAVAVQTVVWGDTGVAIPRETFVNGLAASFGEAPLGATVTPIAPRRVQATAATSPRPATRIDRMLPALHRLPRSTGANENGAIGLPRFDDHVKTYEAHIRTTFNRPADADEISALREADGIVPIEARLSTWAVSLTAATVALPVAAPVLAYNLVKGEDMRAASLALGLAGFFVAMDSSGTMAAVTSLL